MKPCHKCGYAIDNNAKTCDKCGASMENHFNLVKNETNKQNDENKSFDIFGELVLNFLPIFPILISIVIYFNYGFTPAMLTLVILLIIVGISQGG